MGITISTLDCPEELKARLMEEENTLNSEGNNFIIAENKSCNYTLFNIDSQKQDYTNSINSRLAKIIAEVVVDNLESKLISQIIKNDYSQFDQEERQYIKQFTINYLNEKNKAISKIIWKKEIETQLVNYLEKHRDLNIEGFVRFRLKDYVKQLRFAVEKSVDDFIIEKEYQEFIDLLKYFVELQEPTISHVNVLQEEDGSFKILNPEHKVIKNDYLEDCITELMEDEVEDEDLLISALINISPAQIVLHFKQQKVINTLKRIFGERVILCKGCQLCRKNNIDED